MLAEFFTLQMAFHCNLVELAGLRCRRTDQFEIKRQRVSPFGFIDRRQQPCRLKLRITRSNGARTRLALVGHSHLYCSGFIDREAMPSTLQLSNYGGMIRFHPQIRRSSRERSVPLHVERSLMEVVDGNVGDYSDHRSHPSSVS